jgi:hypothetical protein
VSNPADAADQPLDPAAAKMVARVKWLMLISGLTTMVAIAAVIGVIGYRVFRAEGSAATAEVTALLPKGARIVSTAVAEDRIAVTVDIGGATEIRTFDLRTFKPTGRLRFATEP